MGSLWNFPDFSLLQVYFVLIIAFSSSLLHAQQLSNGLEELEDNIQGSYFFYQQPDYPRDCREVYNECTSSNSSGLFLIKPDAYPEQFEVYCHYDVELGGWTVIQRRIDGSVDFNRDWKEYKTGFGFLSTEFWLGNDRLSYLTNQATYELRIDLVLSNGTSLFASCAAFRISDEWSQYSLVSVGDFHGNIDISCPPNMIFGNCSCPPSCDDPTGNSCRDNCDGNITIEECVCLSGFVLKDGECVLPSECGCFVTQTNLVLTAEAGEIHVNADCSEKCICESGSLKCNSSYGCDSNAVCRIQHGVRRCYCNEGYEGDGETCTVVYTDCYDAYQAGHRQDGVYTILPEGWPKSPFNVSCDMTTSGGGWTIFQRRTDGVTDFYRNWDNYKDGFGSVEQGNDFWLGNEQIYYLTNQKAYKLRVDIRTSANTPKYAEYTSFSINNETFKYQLSIGSYSGDAGDGLLAYDNGGSFNTRDQDNDECSYRNCAEGIGGAGWYTAGYCYQCYRGFVGCSYYGTNTCTDWCSYFNLNGVYNGVNGKNVYWSYNCHLRFADMKIRPSLV